ncbi:MAG: hypothetical protein GXY65_16695 [Rhodococcus sp.]|uniref:glutaredoxin family protein n=1 Tax=Rhodococcus TaxID=1827 RepID=UPI00168DAB02|nr:MULTISPECIES: glutaredoxin domain-containing protein [Rhodococcus]NLV80944.1 hypothetical protein [Rhodococcus sp. (in: high G+C Gram-positive bacteria)]
MWRSWLPSTAILGVAVLVLVTGSFAPAPTLVAVVLLVLAWVGSPLFFPRHVDDTSARRDAAARGVPIVYWRPGCAFCTRLRAALGTRAGRAVWVNIRLDPDAAARVRSVNEGNETVPTVFVGDTVRTNPEPRWVRELLG